MYRRPSFLVSALVFILLLFVLSAFIAFVLKIAFLALIIAAAYYLYARAAESLHRRPRRNRRYR
ncbi:hypothetical protein [Alicyclobacillus fastidiosus]|uniref:Uncharacterized protein n=1 Tax=Alicyclobacillus fastidiosus TaxID=392011 RepID=A0ABV5AFQ3_9BACL|nr:hypothetical protein [Alicyclobacillus fastidiosus]WEH11669.1 hypothetical protein PYS47_10905 [Alicyclobacillus fastidiosus]